MTKCSAKRGQTWRWHWRAARLLSRYMPRFFAAITLHSLVDTITPYGLLLLIARFIDALFVSKDMSAVIMWGAITLGAQVLLMILGGLLRRWKEAKWESLYRVSDRILTDHVLSLDFATLDDARTKELLDKVRENTAALGRGLVMIPEIYQYICLGVFGVLGGVASWVVSGAFDLALRSSHPFWLWATVTAWIGGVVASWALARAAQRRYNREADHVVALDRAYYTVMDAMVDPSKAADRHVYRQGEIYARYLDETDRAFFGKRGIKRRGRGAVLSALSGGITVLWVGVWAAFIGATAFTAGVSIGKAISFIGGFALLAKYGHGLYCAYDRMITNAPYLQTVFEALDVPARLYRGSLTTEKRSDGDYEWEFRHVSFSYPGQVTAALTDVSVTLRRGSCTAIVGENGSGKSTFVKLLCRLYDPDEGEILLNGIDIRKYDYAEYMALVAVVFQDFCLLPQPIADNVASMGAYDEDRVRRCLADVGWDHGDDAVIDGIRTPLYQSAFANGMVPTLGEAQKIAIARALYKNAPCVILDEPTAALDPIAEAEIYQGFDRIARDRTAIYISHRLSSCRFCRDILVFDRGRIVERGTHKDLVSKAAGQYRALWEVQAQYYHR